MTSPSSANPPPAQKPLAGPTTLLWVWVLLACWLVYTFTTLGWYLLNDPAFIGSICSER